MAGLVPAIHDVPRERGCPAQLAKPRFALWPGMTNSGDVSDFAARIIGQTLRGRRLRPRLWRTAMPFAWDGRHTLMVRDARKGALLRMRTAVARLNPRMLDSLPMDLIGIKIQCRPAM
jgi:hypothetical protein